MVRPMNTEIKQRKPIVHRKHARPSESTRPQDVQVLNNPNIDEFRKVVEQQGKYVAKELNIIGNAGNGRAKSSIDIDLGAPFVYKHLGSMATIDIYKTLVDLRQSKEAKGISMARFPSWFIWSSAYLTRVISWRNRFYVAINWLTTLVFGRDISRILRRFRSFELKNKDQWIE